MSCTYVCKLIAFLLVSPFVFCNNVSLLPRRTLNAASATHDGARYFPSATGSAVTENEGRSSMLLTCSLWCYGHHTLMLCALPSQECCDVQIKALDLSGWKPQRQLRSCRVRSHAHAYRHTLILHRETSRASFTFAALFLFCRLVKLGKTTVT